MGVFGWSVIAGCLTYLLERIRDDAEEAMDDLYGVADDFEDEADG